MGNEALKRVWLASEKMVDEPPEPPPPRMALHPMSGRASVRARMAGSAMWFVIFMDRA